MILVPRDEANFRGKAEIGFFEDNWNRANFFSFFKTIKKKNTKKRHSHCFKYSQVKLITEMPRRCFVTKTIYVIKCRLIQFVLCIKKNCNLN